MNDVLFMQILDRQTDLIKQAFYLSFRELILLYVLEEITSINIIHNNVQFIIALFS